MITMRILGKRQVGELEVSELIITFMMSDIAAAPILNKKVTLLHAAIPIFLLLLIELIMSHLLLKFPALKNIVAGKPSIIICNGEINQKELKKQRMCLTELISALRQLGFLDIADVQYAILEENGKLSAFPKTMKAPPTAEDMNIKVKAVNPAIPLILDGKIVNENLNGEWNLKRLIDDLDKRKINAKQVFLYSASSDGTVFLVMKK